MRFLSLGFIALALTTATAHADPAQDVSEILYSHAGWVGRTDTPPRSRTPESCREAIAAARAAKVADTFEMEGDVFGKVPGSYQRDGKTYLKLGDADAICTALAHNQQIGAAKAALEAAQHGLDWLGEIDLASNHAENAAKLAKVARECDAAVDTLSAAKLERVEVSRWAGGFVTITIADAKATVCARLAKAATTFAGDVTTARKAAWERAAAPYKAVGISGERLELLVSLSGRALYGRGGTEITSPRQLAKANVLFEVLTAADGTVTVRRYALRGNRVVGKSSKDYLRRPGAAAFR